MGCNFYTLKGEHIGKRYAAGFWCWDCKVECLIHLADGRKVAQEEWGKVICLGEKVSVSSTSIRECPKCHTVEDIFKKGELYNPGLRELGFDKSKPIELKGLNGASGFYWAGSKEQWLQKLKKVKFVKDEYNRKYSVKEFLDIFKQIIPEEEVGGKFS